MTTLTTSGTDLRWSTACLAAELARGQTIALRVGGQALALFRTCDGEFFALADLDPHADEAVRHGALSGGHLASRRDVPVVVAAGTGRRYELGQGTCVDGGSTVTTFPVRVVDGAVEVAVPGA